MTKRPPTVLLTGFGAFPGIAENATASLVPELAAMARDHFPGHVIVDEVLPVEWSRTPRVLEEILMRTKPVVALHFGVTRHTSGFQIELMGRNTCDPRSDAVGELPATACVIEAGPETIASSFPADRIIARLERAGIACTTSQSAGTYLCNAVLYQSLTHAQGLPGCVAGFIHLPAGLSASCTRDETCALMWSDALNGGIEVIAACLEEQLPLNHRQPH